MSAQAPLPRQAPVAAWIAQMIGTLVLCATVLAFVHAVGAPLATGRYDFQRYMLVAILVAALPAILYVRHFKRLVLQDEAAVAAAGVADPTRRRVLMKGLALGGALCELPMALGIVHMLFGGETRWFIYATLITIAVRLSYRPFTGRKTR
jgi:hypothetical protein